MIQMILFMPVYSLCHRYLNCVCIYTLQSIRVIFKENLLHSPSSLSIFVWRVMVSGVRNPERAELEMANGGVYLGYWLDYFYFGIRRVVFWMSCDENYQILVGCNWSCMLGTRTSNECCLFFPPYHSRKLNSRHRWHLGLSLPFRGWNLVGWRGDYSSWSGLWHPYFAAQKCNRTALIVIFTEFIADFSE